MHLPPRRMIIQDQNKINLREIIFLQCQCKISLQNTFYISSKTILQNESRIFPGTKPQRCPEPYVWTATKFFPRNRNSQMIRRTSNIIREWYSVNGAACGMARLLREWYSVNGAACGMARLLREWYSVVPREAWRDYYENDIAWCRVRHGETTTRMI